MNRPQIHSRLKPSLAQNKHLIHRLRVRCSSFCSKLFLSHALVTQGNTGYHILIFVPRCAVLRCPTSHILAYVQVQILSRPKSLILAAPTRLSTGVCRCKLIFFLRNFSLISFINCCPILSLASL